MANSIRVDVKSSDPRRDGYTVTFHDEQWKCTCPHWVYRLKESKGRCKHIDGVIRKAQEYQATLAQIDREYDDIEW